MRLGHVEFGISFICLEVPDALLILGMDQMRRFKCVVDLERDRLVFGGAGGVDVPFLPPSSARAPLREVVECHPM